eukprot:CAMPEP_0181224970 /NCGR_PEP_ID=MMETSP1096-20121128/31427_1 /TAXON_ID=156174 ORGANISM="Chrysochromulina ericina, Strain CCMP281" /NCGR_SAMPLE_ID=MMETSP1096 /ASSEMBLY_ACC=CAM_ASM_000453 /LENGTH=106 /DNA_ID=CAMNT_0023318121 /DNA_START=284 /DNA_END=602 /DNA_ORIENTATION=-
MALLLRFPSAVVTKQLAHQVYLATELAILRSHRRSQFVPFAHEGRVDDGWLDQFPPLLIKRGSSCSDSSHPGLESGAEATNAICCICCFTTATGTQALENALRCVN